MGRSAAWLAASGIFDRNLHTLERPASPGLHVVPKWLKVAICHTLKVWFCLWITTTSFLLAGGSREILFFSSLHLNSIIAMFDATSFKILLCYFCMLWPPSLRPRERLSRLNKCSQLEVTKFAPFIVSVQVLLALELCCKCSAPRVALLLVTRYGFTMKFVLILPLFI